LPSSTGKGLVNHLSFHKKYRDIVLSSSQYKMI
jgi:hypothetical protein